MSSNEYWFLQDRETEKIVRGPYKSAEAAAAVRTEMEHNGEERNLWVVIQDFEEFE